MSCLFCFVLGLFGGGGGSSGVGEGVLFCNFVVQEFCEETQRSNVQLWSNENGFLCQNALDASSISFWNEDITM